MRKNRIFLATTRGWQTILFASCLLLACNTANAQIFTTVIDETALEFRVKQVDEFFLRFNYETNYKGEKPSDPTDRIEHKKNLLTLFNLEKYSDGQNESDSTLTKFIDYIIDNDVKIHYEDSTWCAEAIGALTYEGKKKDVTFFLKTERLKEFMYRWAITDIQSPIFEQFPHVPKDTIKVSPAEHGISFITLPETINLNKTAVGTAFAKGYIRSNLNVFDFLVATGKIKVNVISKVIFHFHLKDFDFDVERIEKDKGYNQGWLINNIKFKEKTDNEG